MLPPPASSLPASSLPAPPHTLRRRITGTLLLALLLTGVKFFSVSALCPAPGLLACAAAALLMNAAAWEVWRHENGKGHLLELFAGLVFPWAMLLVLQDGMEGGEDEKDSRNRYIIICFCYWLLLALALLFREAFRLRGCGPASIQQSVGRSMRQFLYPTGLLGLVLTTPDSIWTLTIIGLFFRLCSELTRSTPAAIALTLLCIFASDGICSLISGQLYGLLWLFDAEALLICAALLLPCIKLVRVFRGKLGGGESPLPLLGFLGDLLAIISIPCALGAIIILIACIVFGVGGALSLWQ